MGSCAAFIQGAGLPRTMKCNFVAGCFRLGIARTGFWTPSTQQSAVRFMTDAPTRSLVEDTLTSCMPEVHMAVVCCVVVACVCSP